MPSPKPKPKNIVKAPKIELWTKRHASKSTSQFISKQKGLNIVAKRD